jgi:hypothetical protein
MSDPGAESERTSVERLATAKCVSPPSNSMPLALIDVWNKVFWKGTREHRLLALKDDQDHVWFPYDPAFSVVHPQKSKWVELSGEGTVVSWVVLHQRRAAEHREQRDTLARAFARRGLGPAALGDDVEDAIHRSVGVS